MIEYDEYWYKFFDIKDSLGTKLFLEIDNRRGRYGLGKFVAVEQGNLEKLW